MKHCIFFTILCCLVSLASGQNLLDEQGRKTGHWRVEYPNGNVRYEGDFVAGRPVGLMKRYDESGMLSARIRFEAESKLSRAILYFKDGDIAAEGNYLEKAKDSVWTYFSGRDGSVLSRESYRQGLMHGPVTHYYPEGGISETINWSEGKKDGSWYQYYEDGLLRLEGFYSGNKLNGAYRVWFPGGALMMEGEMENDLSKGIWNYYNEKGELLHSLEYQEGVPSDRKVYLELMENNFPHADTSRAPDAHKPF